VSNDNDVIIIQLDKPREIRFGHKALKKLSALTGRSLEDLEAGGVDFEQIEVFIYCGILADAQNNGEALELEQMEDLLDKAPKYVHVIEKMQEAFEASFGGMAEGNLPAPIQPAQNRAQRRGAGRKA